MRISAVLYSTVFLLLWLANVLAYGAPIGAVQISPTASPAGVAAITVVTATITDPTVIGSSVNLQKLDPQGRAVVVGNLRDDGLEGDAAAGDRVYSIRFTIFEETPGTLSYRVSAAVQGKITRVFSGLLSFSVSGASATGINITQPANLVFVNTSPVIVAGSTGDTNATVMVNGIQAAKSGKSYQTTVPLQEGNNTITAVATNSNNTSSTASIQVTLDTTPPKVTVDAPSDGSTTTEPTVTVTGIVNDIVVGTVNSQQAQVTVNGVNAQVANRTYVAADIPLQLGPNTIQVIGRDQTGNSATTTVNVTREAITQPYIKLVSGNNQSAPIGTALASPLVVQLLNGSTPVPNKPVIFKITENDGFLQPGGGKPQLIAVNTDAEGKAQATLTLGNRAGAGNNIVEAYAAGYQGTVIFAASGTPQTAAQINVDSGNNQFGPVNKALPLPFVAVVTDKGYNRLGGIPVTFTVKQGGGSFNGTSTFKTTTDSDGRALAVLTLGSQPGQDNNLIEANFAGNPGFAAAFTATGKVPGDPAQTSISGVVLDNSNNPIPGVTMRVFQPFQGTSNNQHVQVGDPVVTDDKGAFKILPAPVGIYKLMADGTTATVSGKQFPTLEYDMLTVAGQDNTVGMPIYLPALDADAKVCVTPTTGGVLKMASSPGFSLTIAPGSATFPGGSRTGCVSVTPVNPDKVPMVPGFGQQPRYVVTIQPVGTTFNPPAAMTIPNMDGLAPNAKTEMYSYDHDLAAFVAIGSGTVSADGSVIASDPGIGVMKAGWHCGGNPNSTGSAGTCPDCQKCQGSNCVADNTQIPAQNSPIDCKKEVCSGGSKVSQPNDTEQPQQTSPTDCKKQICNGGSVSNQNDDSEQPTNICKKCTNGQQENTPNGATPRNPDRCCFDGQDLPKLNNPYDTLTTKCPAKQQVQESVRQHEIDGCSNSPDDLESWDDLPFATNYNLYVTNPIWGTVLGRISNADAAAQTLPCNAHDICYQTCGSDQAACDTAIGGGITASCDIGYPSPCARQDQSECAEYENEYQSCRTIGPIYTDILRQAGGSAYKERQTQYCSCC